MSDMTDERMIEVLRKEGREYRAEIKGLKDIEDFRVSVIKELQAENKALKETLDKTTDLVIDLYKRLETVEESRDELLEVLRFTLRHHALYYDAELLKQAIEKAESVKEKETK